MKPGDSIPADHDVIHYVGGSQVYEYGVDGVAFELREGDMLQPEPGLSCNWLDFFAGMSKDEQVDRVRAVIHLQPGRDAKYGELNVGATLNAIRDSCPHARFSYKPMSADGQYLDDLSHCELLGLPNYGTHESELIGDKIAKLVQQTYPARP